MTAKRPSFAVDPHIRSRAISAIMTIGMASAVLFALSPLLRDDENPRTAVDLAKKSAATTANQSESSRPTRSSNIRKLAYASERDSLEDVRIPSGVDRPGHGSVIAPDGLGSIEVPSIDLPSDPVQDLLVPSRAIPDDGFAGGMTVPHTEIPIPSLTADSDPTEPIDDSNNSAVGAEPSDRSTPLAQAPAVTADSYTDPAQTAPQPPETSLAQQTASQQQQTPPQTAQAAVAEAIAEMSGVEGTQWTPRQPTSDSPVAASATSATSATGAVGDQLAMSAPAAASDRVRPPAGLYAPLLDFNTEQPIQFGKGTSATPEAAAPAKPSPYGLQPVETPQAEAPAPQPQPSASTPGQGAATFSPPAPPLPMPPGGAPATTAPAPRRGGNGPIVAVDPLESVKIADNGEITLHLDNVEIRRVLEMFSRSHSMNILVAPGVQGSVTANFESVPVDAALNAVLELCNLTARAHGNNMLFVYPQSQIPKADLQLRVIDLDFANAEDLLPTVISLLTPSGKAFPSTVDENDNMSTKEAIVVTDVPSAVARVEDYLRQVDHAPKQVLIEASVMEIELDHTQRHGVNYQHFLGDFELGLAGMANPSATSAFFAQVSSSQVNALLECLRSSNQSRTLASPRVMVVNGQTARIQVGQQLGYKVVTATQAAAVEDVRFLEVGVVLQVTPKISRDNRVLMRVKPEVSNGEVNPDTDLPEEETREVETDVLLANGQGLVIGGLIQEEDVNFEQNVPYLDKVPVIGRVFRKKADTTRRSEIVITLVPKVCDCPPGEILINSEEVPIHGNGLQPAPMIGPQQPVTIPSPTSALPRVTR